MSTATKSKKPNFLDMTKGLDMAATKKEPGDKPTLVMPELEKAAAEYARHMLAIKSSETMAQQAKDQITTPARVFLMAECERTGEDMSSVAVKAGAVNITYTLGSRYNDIKVEDMPLLSEVFGDEMEEYFNVSGEVSLKSELITQEVLDELRNAVGEEFYAKFFTVKPKVRVTKAFHHRYLASTTFREKCDPLIEAGRIKPYAASLFIK